MLQQIEQWNADDEEQKIIDAILKVPEEERTAELTGLLARSYNNQGNYNEAIEQLLSVKEECKEDALWFYRLGYAYYYRVKKLVSRTKPGNVSEEQAVELQRATAELRSAAGVLGI